MALLARDEPRLGETLAAVREAGGEGGIFTADVTDERAIARAHKEIERSLGPVDVLVNNAGVGGPAGEMWELDPGEWWRTVEVNLRGTFLCAWTILPGMVKRSRGRIVTWSATPAPTVAPTSPPKRSARPRRSSSRRASRPRPAPTV